MQNILQIVRLSGRAECHHPKQTWSLRKFDINSHIDTQDRVDRGNQVLFQ